MTSIRSIKKALLCSLLSLVVGVSSLIGTTFAWFTDSVSSANNLIVAGKLDVELEYLDDSGAWTAITENTNVFTENAKWEPGYTEVVYLRVSNMGTLSLKYQLGVNIAEEIGSVNVFGDNFLLSDHIRLATIEGIQTPFEDREDAIEAARYAYTLSDGYTKRGVMQAGDAAHYVALVVYMPESVGNEANYATGATAPEIKLGINLFATQNASESDSLGSDYDEGALLPDFIGTYRIPVFANDLNADWTTSKELTVRAVDSSIRATIPQGVKVEKGTDCLMLSLSKTKRSGNIDMNAGEVSLSLDVHIAGVAKDNTVPMQIDLGSVLPLNLKDSSVKLYHVENGEPVLMTKVDNFTAHNQYVYDPTTGEVSVNLRSFSEVTAVVATSDPWNGSIDTSWYNVNDVAFTIDTAEEFAGFAAIVGGMAKDKDGFPIARDTFKDKTVTLSANLDLGASSGKVWYPVGYYNSTGIYERTAGVEVSSSVYTFAGTFDGNGHTISNIYQNTWEMFGDYNDGYSGTPNYYKDGMGIFGYVNGGTVKNLNVHNFQSDGEFTPTGCVTAYARNATFDKITVTGSNPRVYNTGNGGIVGIAGNNDDTDELSVNFSNINIDNTNKISALWGSWDVGCGGVIGMYRGNSKVKMENCEIGAIIDVYNDVCANYQYYQYRYSGMLIGTAGKNSAPSDTNFHFENVNVYIGNWADYYYCEFEKNSGASYTDDFQFSRVEKSDINFNDDTNMPDFANGKPCKHEHTANEDKMGLYLPFNQLYTGYGWGSSPVDEHEGVTVIRYFYMITYRNAENTETLGVEYVTKGDRLEDKLWADAYTIRTDPITKFNENKTRFVGWVNSGSAPVTTIQAGNRNDVVLFESWTNPYTARFVDQFGNVIYSQTFTKENPTVSIPAFPEVENCTGDWSTYDSKNEKWVKFDPNNLTNATGDITIRPIYTYKGKLKLTPVDDPKDGVIDYYKVEAVSDLDVETTIPGYFNGLPVKVVEKLYKNKDNFDYGSGVKTIIIGEGVEELVQNSLAYTSDLDTVKLPSTITTLGKNTFSRNWGDDEKVLTIEFNGTMEEWKAINKNEDWHNGLKSGSTVKCSDGKFVLTMKEYLWGAYESYTWTEISNNS